VSDIIDANLLIAEGLADMSILSGRSFTISDPDTRWPVDAIVRACEKATGYPIKSIEYLDVARDEGQSIRLDSTAIRLLGWSPKISLEQGLFETANWLALELGVSTMSGIR
jgi:nucleoside-diphosphate-sugar epimerase